MFVFEDDEWAAIDAPTVVEEQPQQALELEEQPLDALDEEQKKQLAIDDIHTAVIKAQEQLAIVDNKIDAYKRQYGVVNEELGRIYNWTLSVAGTAARAQKTAKAALVSDGMAKTFAVDGFLFDITKTSGGIALDVQKLKTVDRSTYDYLSRMYPRKVADSTKVSVKEQKGAVSLPTINYGENSESN